ncbi:hypothetical protein [Pseudoxanthomonas beigongshangi]|uniref:hypothetical protein n=1 Tax=Pseudoxanthomonas beigongshangi TaxID=2782537 RepID=UPI00193B7052|nr:hypothetical protein [Pseudoxanthomonas beigongshangi]
MRSCQPFDFLTGRWRQRAFVLVLLAAVGFDLHAAASVSVVEAADIHLQAYLQAEARQVERLSAYLRNETPSSCTERCDIPSLPGVAIERRLQEALAARGVAETPALTSRIGAITQAMTEGVRRSRCHALDASSAFFGAATPEEAGEAMVRFRCDLPDAAVALRHAATLREHGDSVSVDALLRTHLDAAMALLRAPLRTVDAEMLMHRDTGGGWRTMLPAQWMEYFLALLEHADAPATAVPAANLYLRAHLGFVVADRKKLDDYLRSSLDPARDEPGTTLADLLNSLDEETAWDENVAVVRLTGTFLPHREGGKLARLFEEIPQQRIQAPVPADGRRRETGAMHGHAGGSASVRIQPSCARRRPLPASGHRRGRRAVPATCGRGDSGHREGGGRPDCRARVAGPARSRRLAGAGTHRGAR